MTKDYIVENAFNSIPSVTIVEQLIYDNRSFHEKQIDIDSERDLRRRELIRKYDQKDKILREIAKEQDERRKREAERLKYLNQRRIDHQKNESRLDQETQLRMTNYRREVDTAVNTRQNNINNEWTRLKTLNTTIENEHQRFKEDLNQKRDTFLANYRKQYDILQRELNDALNQRDVNQQDLDRLKREL